MAQYQQLALEKFTEGMIDEDQLSRVNYPEGSCVVAEDIIFMPTGAIKKRLGYDAMGTWLSAQGNNIMKVYSYTTTGSPGIDYAITFSCSSSTASAHIASVQTTGVGSSVAVFKEIYIKPTSAESSWAPLETEPIAVTTYGGSAIFTYDSATDGFVIWPATDATADAVINFDCPSGARLAQAWGTFLFLGNVQYSGDASQHGSRIQWNHQQSINVWLDDQWIELDPDDGDEITAMCVYQNKLIVWKKYKMFQVHYVGGNLMFQEERISDSIGCLGSNAWIDSGGTIYFIGAYTAYKWSGSGEPEAISDKIQSQWDNINLVYGKIFDVDSDDSNWQVWFNVVDGAATSKNLIYAYDTRFKSWTRFTLSATTIGGINYGKTESYADRPSAYSSYPERIRDSMSNKEGVMSLGGAGILYQYGSSQQDAGTSAVTGQWLSRWMDFGLPHSNKRLLRATAYVEREGDYYLHTDLYTDWNTSVVTPSGAQMVNLSGYVDYPMLEERVDFTKQFRAVQFRIYTDGSNEPYTLHKLLIDWVPKGKTKVSALASG